MKTDIHQTAAMTAINLVIIDQNSAGVPDYSAGLHEDQAICVAARSALIDDAAALCADFHPDVLLVSTRCLRDANPAWLVDLREQHTATHVVLVHDALSEAALLECLGTGARGWIGTGDVASVSKAVHAVHAGEAWVPRRLARRLVDRLIENERCRIV